MHESAMLHGKLFFETYCKEWDLNKTIIDVGSQDVNGSLKKFCPEGIKYIGVDFVEGNGVDLVLTDPYKLPFEDSAIDAIVCSSVFEHCEFFWLLYLECIRVLKPNGLFYLNTPSNGFVHRYPVDSWRFYPDAGHSLNNWSHYNSYNTELLESFTAEKMGSIDGDGMWNDFVAIIIKDKSHSKAYKDRVIHKIKNYICGFDSMNKVENSIFTQNSDHAIIMDNKQQIENLNLMLAEHQRELALRDIQLAERDTQIADRNTQIAELDTQIADRDNQISKITRSLSWKITTPLRMIAALAGK